MKRENKNIKFHVNKLKSEQRRKGINKIIVALSGGADSICLSFLLKNTGCELLALHANFHLRREESDRDQLFVEEFCRSNEIKLICKDFDVKEFIASNPGKSIEMACRQLRYDWFREIAGIYNADRIVTGHNADDNIETMFLNMLRGCGTRGLKGMDEDTGEIWRPLLSLHRKEILDVISESGLSFITDSTNLKSDFRRNFLRNEIFPLLRSKWRGFDTALDTTLSHIKTENYLIESILEKEIADNKNSLPTERIINFPDPELLIRRFIDDLYPYKSTAKEIWSAIRADKPHVRRWKVTKGDIILRNKVLYKESHK